MKDNSGPLITYLGLGSNLGNREENLIRAVGRIGALCPLLRYSSIYRTDPVGYTDQPEFLNMVIEVDAQRTDPLGLLGFVKSIEREMGRKNNRRWGPRNIDIDILYMTGITLDTYDLRIPHSRMFERRFVLVPLREITDTLPSEHGPVDIEDVSTESEGQGVSLYRPREELDLYAGA